MSSYMNSNQPYNRVDDGIGAGLLWGAALGGAGYYGTKLGVAGYQGKKFTEGTQHLYNKRMDKINNNKETSRLSKYKTGQNAFFQAAALNNKDFGKSLAFKAFGRGRNRAITGGAALLAGGILGASIDAAND